ncbi:MAG: metallophosphoesterase family protein [Petrimonas sp.]|jgi:3',5'-cyclic AMP phosphodiesterase CpdA
MENFKLKIISIFFIIALSSCEEFEMKGFFTTYESINPRFEQSVKYNNLNGYSKIVITQSNYTIYAMGDSHVGGTKNLDRFLKDAQDENATAVVMVGDLTTGHKKDYDLFLKHLPLKESLVYFPIVGNHDLYFDGWKHFYSIFGSSTYIFVINTSNESDLFICLDTGGGTIGSKQLDWFKNVLETERDNYRNCIVFTHNNIFRLRPTTSANPMVEEIHVLIDLFLRHNVNMVVTGHDHKRNTAVLGNTTHIIMDALQDTNSRASYLKLSINADNINYSFVEL